MHIYIYIVFSLELKIMCSWKKTFQTEFYLYNEKISL